MQCMHMDDRCDSEVIDGPAAFLTALRMIYKTSERGYIQLMDKCAFTLEGHCVPLQLPSAVLTVAFQSHQRPA